MSNKILMFTAAALLASQAPAAVTYTETEDKAFIEQKLSVVNDSVMAHPRFLKGQLDYLGIVNAAVNNAERRTGLDNVIRVLSPAPKLGDPHGKYSLENLDPEMFKRFEANSFDDDWWTILRYIETTSEAAFAYHVRGGSTLLKQVTERIKKFGSVIATRGCTEDRTRAREYVWHFALAYDFAYPGLSDTDRALVADVIAKCVDRHIDATLTEVAKPYANTASNTMAKFGAGLLLVRGDKFFVDKLDPEWVKTSTRAFLTRMPMFGGPDGGYGNGSYYSLYNLEYLPVLDVFDRVLTYPLYDQTQYITPINRHVALLPKYMLYTLPPGSPAGAFGDGAELPMVEERGRFLRSLYSRNHWDWSKWYLQQIRNDKVGDTGRMQFLLSPSENQSAPAIPTPVLSDYFPSVGVAAFHSDFNDRDRLSILFRSSPFGSENHAHADQNSFVIYHKRKILAMDSGAYTVYGHAHRLDYAKQTKAHNAITYDGGKGQEVVVGPFGSASAKGQIVAFNSPGTKEANGSLLKNGVYYDIVTGDALAAYGSALKQAKRTMVFVRPSTLVVIDQLQSADTARKWEYNLHTGVAGEPLSTTASNSEVLFSLPDSDARMCVKVRSPHALKPRTVTPGYPVSPGAAHADHFWSQYAYNAASVSGVFVSVYRMDCLNPSAQDPENITFNGTNATVTAGGLVIKLENGNVTVN